MKYKMKKLMLHWVYIYEDEQGILKIGMSADLGKSMADLREDEHVVYVHPFRKPFDAAAHKILLEYLSQESIQLLIKKQKEKTEVFLSSSIMIR